MAELEKEGFDCILGGIDPSIRCGWLSVHELPKPIPPSRAPSKTASKNKERDALLALENAFPVFPSPRGCSRHGAKVSFNQTLEQISTDMGMSRPKTEHLVELQNPPRGMVLKREFSDTSTDVFIPRLSDPEEAEIKRAISFIKKRTRANPSDNCRWLAQEYAPCLRFVEVRFMCVNGTPIREIVTGTHPDDHPEAGQTWGYEHNDALKTRADLQ